MFTRKKCCCDTTPPGCPTNCNCDGTGVTVQFTTETQTSTGNICNTTVQTRRVVGTVTDAQGTWKFFGLPFNGTNSGTFTSCYNPSGSPTLANPFGARKTGVNYYFDDGENPCGILGSQTLRYIYSFSCVGDGTVSLSVHAPLINCSFNGLTYYGPNPTGAVGLSFVAQSIATPSCDGSNLTASFTFGNLSGGQAPPSTTASVSINLADNGLFCCQTFHVVDGSGNPISGVDVRVTGPDSRFVAVETDAGGIAVISWHGSCEDLDVDIDSNNYLTGVTFVKGGTTTIVVGGGLTARVPRPARPKSPEPAEDLALRAFIAKHGCCG